MAFTELYIGFQPTELPCTITQLQYGIHFVRSKSTWLEYLICMPVLNFTLESVIRIFLGGCLWKADAKDFTQEIQDIWYIHLTQDYQAFRIGLESVSQNQHQSSGEPGVLFWTTWTKEGKDEDGTNNNKWKLKEA